MYVWMLEAKLLSWESPTAEYPSCKTVTMMKKRCGNSCFKDQIELRMVSCAVCNAKVFILNVHLHFRIGAPQVFVLQNVQKKHMLSHVWVKQCLKCSCRDSTTFLSYLQMFGLKDKKYKDAEARVFSPQTGRIFCSWYAMDVEWAVSVSGQWAELL